MNRSELVQIVGRKTNLDQPVIDDVLNTLLQVITVTLTTGEEVNVRGFGKFTLSNRAAATLKHPRNGEPISIEPRRTVSFKPAVGLKEKMNLVPL